MSKLIEFILMLILIWYSNNCWDRKDNMGLQEILINDDDICVWHLTDKQCKL